MDYVVTPPGLASDVRKVEVAGRGQASCSSRTPRSGRGRAVDQRRLRPTSAPAHEREVQSVGATRTAAVSEGPACLRLKSLGEVEAAPVPDPRRASSGT